MNLENYTDKDIIAGILLNNESIIKYFLFEKCKPIISNVIYNVFNNKANRDELINELYLYLASNEWYKIKQFDYRSKLTTWLTVVAVRYFIKNKDRLIEKASSSAPIGISVGSYITNMPIENKIDIYDALDKMNNTRYKRVIIALDLNDAKPNLVADEMGITTDNLYNIHRRARFQLYKIMKEEDYD